MRLAVIPYASGDSLSTFVIENIREGSEIITDIWTGFLFVKNSGYRHTVCVQSKKRDDEHPFPHVHLVVSLLKRWLLGTHQVAVSDKYMQSYLEEYTFRSNRRNFAKRGLLFYRLFEGALNIHPHTYDDMVNLCSDFQLS